MSIAVNDEDAPDMREYLLSRRPTHDPHAIPVASNVTMREAQKDFQTHEAEALEGKAVSERVPQEEEEDELEKLRKARVAQLKRESQWRSQGHGEYTEITEPEFLPHVTSSHFVVCHFYHSNFEKCKVMDKHVGELAGALLSVKFLKLNAEKAMFFVGKLGIRVLPTLVLFREGVAIHHVVGFEGLLGGPTPITDDFSTESLRQRILSVFNNNTSSHNTETGENS